MSNVQSGRVEARSTRGTVPISRITMNGDDLAITVQEMTVSCIAGQHDQVTLNAISTELDNTDGMLDSAINFSFGKSPHMERFAGYIVDVTQEQTSQGSLSFTLSILGATKVMYEGAPRFWTGKTIPGAIQDLAHRNMLGYNGHDHSQVWQALAQTSESDWEFVSSLAKRIGYSLFNRYGIVLCQNPMELIRNAGTYARLVAGEDVDVSTDRYLIEFEPAEKADVVQQNLGWKFGYFATDGRVHVDTQKGTFKGYLFEPEHVIRDQTESKSYLDAIDLNTGNWKQHAMARIWGDADIYPGMCVEVVTKNTRFLRDKYDGRWLVHSTGQSMDRQQYQTVLYMCRPSSNLSVTANAYRPFWAGDSRGRPRPSLVLEQGKWVSSWTDRRVRSLL